MHSKRREHRTRHHRHAVGPLERRLAVGECFVYDARTYEDGDLLYGEVEEVLEPLPPGADVIGDDKSGCRVRVHCAADREQQTPDGVEDYYAWDTIERFGCIVISRAQMMTARNAGWPSHRAFLDQLRQDEGVTCDER